MSDEKITKTLKAVIDFKPIEEKIDESREVLNELFNILVPVFDDLDLLYEFDKFKRTYEEVIKLYQMQSYRDGFKSGVMLFTS